MKSEEFHQNGSFKTLALFSASPRIRIADILAEEEEGFAGGDCALGGFAMDGDAELRRDRLTSIQCSSPRKIIARCLAALRPRRRALLFGRGKMEDEAVGESAGVSAVSATCSMNGSNGVDSPVSAPASEVSGRCRTDVSFNLGVACGLLYLMSASKNEMSKMIEVRKQMEMLLQNFREELQSKNSPLKPIERFANFNPQLSLEMNSPCTTSYVVPESETILECDDGSSQCVMDEQDQQRVSGMDELEAELEAELELLEINLDTGHSSKRPQQQSLMVVDTPSSVSESPSSGEVIINPQETHTEMQTEVSPIELERKLHELLEARQQERILELEAALEITKRNLREKELEISWWKDTARIILHHVPERPPLVSQPNPKTFHLLR